MNEIPLYKNINGAPISWYRKPPAELPIVVEPSDSILKAELAFTIFDSGTMSGITEYTDGSKKASHKLNMIPVANTIHTCSFPVNPPIPINMFYFLIHINQNKDNN